MFSVDTMLPYVPKYIRWFYPSLLWEVKTQEKKIYLTFDDGPIPEITEQVIELLARYDAKATFFCIGENIQKHPEIFRKLIEANHSIGNHTFHHRNGWKTPTADYLNEVQQCDEQIERHISIEKSLFRPPYGRITPKQIALLKASHELVMWSVLTMDYDQQISPEKCFENSIKRTKSGSIVVFHDSLKASKNMLYALPRFLAYFSEKGFSFEGL